MIGQLIGLFGGLVFLGSCCFALLNLGLIIEAIFTKDKNSLKLARKVLLTSLIVGMVGFGTCSALFELKLG